MSNNATMSTTSPEVLRWLGGAYALLAVAITHPHHNTLERCRHAAGVLLEHPPSDKVRDPLEWMAAYDPDEAEILSLEVEFTRLFVNAYPKTPLPPYESVQRGEGGLWGTSTVEVVRSYAEAGLMFQRANGVAPDHLSAELEFAGFLLASASAAHQSDEGGPFIELYEHHLSNHLAPWAGDFCRKVEDQARMDFYRAFGRLGAALIDLETERVTRERRAVCNG